jgi:hypothetical protein
MVNQIREYTPSGTLVESLNLSGLTNIHGLTVLNNEVYVASFGGTIGKVNLTTGAVENQFTIPRSLEGLGDNGTNLLAYEWLTGDPSANVGTIVQLTTSGTTVSTVSAVHYGGVGIDGTSDGRSFIPRSFFDGNIREYNSAGTLLSTIVTGVGTGTHHALGYQSSNSTLWVSQPTAPFGGGNIRQYSMSGTELSQFNFGSGFIMGLDFVNEIPEPASVALLSVASVLLASRRRLKA